MDLDLESRENNINLKHKLQHRERSYTKKGKSSKQSYGYIIKLVCIGAKVTINVRVLSDSPCVTKGSIAQCGDSTKARGFNGLVVMKIIRSQSDRRKTRSGDVEEEN